MPKLKSKAAQLAAAKVYAKKKKKLRRSKAAESLRKKGYGYGEETK